jgi:hypothetical protein
MNDQDHSLSLSDPDRSLVLSHFITNFLQNLASCHTAFTFFINSKNLLMTLCLVGMIFVLPEDIQYPRFT